ncbi:apoptosis-inducing factor 3 [Ceratitis capitata]|uniref:apoptosis-inducing factor 3 n=1 Tax=Ceratitis capitata TaxID=7213 RepID=UPI000329BF6A|nr:apoptosis-inducing factor 3 [Ceratitis capitata]
MSEFTDFVAICKESDINNDEVKEFDFDRNNKFLLIRQNDRIWAVGATCPHQGAPLVKGVLGRGRIRCSRHGSCYDIKTGDIEDFPGLDSLPSYPVEISKDGEVKVRARHKDLNKTRRIKKMSSHNKLDERIFLLIGGGVASATCAETLRQEGYVGRIIILCGEDSLPYDRTPLSKVWQVNHRDMELRSEEFYEQHNIEIILGVEAIKLDTYTNTVSCSNEQQIKYDKLFIATGSRPAKLATEGIGYRNVFSLQNFVDLQAIMSVLRPRTNLICTGGGFISLELSSTIISKVRSVLVISHLKYPLEVLYGEEIGKRLLNLYRERGVQMKMESRMKDILSDDGVRVTEVRTTDGYKYPCDVLLIAVGVVPNTDWVIDSDVPVNIDGTIDTDMNLRTPVPNIYAGGDIANAPVLSYSNQRKCVKHYQVAQYHGRIAGINMAGHIQELRTVPFFNASFFSMSFLQAGFGSRHDIFIHGDLKRLKYVVYVSDRDGNVTYVSTCGYDSAVISYCELLAQGKRLHRSEVADKSNPSQWMEQLLDTRRKRCSC